MWETVTLIGADLELDAEGTPFLLAVYDHAWWDRRIGLRRQLDHGPMSEVPGRTRAEALALDIAMYDMAEPLGSYWDLLVEDDNGVWWWGDGYPGLTP
jgi:hypothetical protein